MSLVVLTITALRLRTLGSLLTFGILKEAIVATVLLAIGSRSWEQVLTPATRPAVTDCILPNKKQR